MVFISQNSINEFVFESKTKASRSVFRISISNLLEILIPYLDVLKLRSEVYKLVQSFVDHSVTVEQLSLLEVLL